MTEIQNDVGSLPDAKMMNEAITKLALRVENLEKGAISEGSAGTYVSSNKDFGPMLVSTLARLKEIHASLVSGMSTVQEDANRLKAAEETIAKQAYQIKHLKRSLEAEENLELRLEHLKDSILSVYRVVGEGYLFKDREDVKIRLAKSANMI